MTDNNFVFPSEEDVNVANQPAENVTSVPEVASVQDIPAAEPASAAESVIATEPADTAPEAIAEAIADINDATAIVAAPIETGKKPKKEKKKLDTL